MLLPLVRRAQAGLVAGRWCCGTSELASLSEGLYSSRSAIGLFNERDARAQTRHPRGPSSYRDRALIAIANSRDPRSAPGLRNADECDPRPWRPSAGPHPCSQRTCIEGEHAGKPHEPSSMRLRTAPLMPCRAGRSRACVAPAYAADICCRDLESMPHNPDANTVC